MPNICYIVNNSQAAIKKLLIDKNVNGSEYTWLSNSHENILATWVTVFRNLVTAALTLCSLIKDNYDAITYMWMLLLNYGNLYKSNVTHIHLVLS